MKGRYVIRSLNERAAKQKRSTASRYFFHLFTDYASHAAPTPRKLHSCVFRWSYRWMSGRHCVWHLKQNRNRLKQQMPHAIEEWWPGINLISSVRLVTARLYWTERHCMIMGGYAKYHGVEIGLLEVLLCGAIFYIFSVSFSFVEIKLEPG